ncbi:MAG: hypothetical protein M3Q65_06590, partial [Chloroflexota bacterium]|nr:hypothetical protein [Chloroflexota bacterium]
MRDPKRRAALLPGVGLGLAILVGWLVAWRLLSGEAARFAPATALVGLACWVLSARYAASPRPALPVGLRVAAWGALGLAVAASFSLGAFLPPALADWVS